MSIRMDVTGEFTAEQGLCAAASLIRAARHRIDDGDWPIIETAMAIGSLLAAVAAVDVALDTLSLSRLSPEMRALYGDDEEPR